MIEIFTEAAYQLARPYDNLILKDNIGLATQSVHSGSLYIQGLVII